MSDRRVSITLGRDGKSLDWPRLASISGVASINAVTGNLWRFQLCGHYPFRAEALKVRRVFIF